MNDYKDLDAIDFGNDFETWIEENETHISLEERAKWGRLLIDFIIETRNRKDFKTQGDIAERIGEFVKLVNQKYGNIVLEANFGKKYCKLIRARSGVWGFIELSNGDILKAADWRKPAKHARGNIFSADYGMSGVNEYGPNYLR